MQKDEHIFISDAEGSRIIHLNESCISPYDHGLLYGDGVFEGIRIYDGRIFKFEDHIDRLYKSAEGIGLEIPVPKDELSWKTIELCRKNNLKDKGYIRPVVTRGVGDLGINPKKCSRPTVFVIASSIQLYPPELYDKGLEVIIAKTPRVSDKSLSPNIKSLNYLNNIQAVREANDAGVREAIMLDPDGYIAECTADNFFMIFNNEVYTPTARCCLKGITRGVIKEICLHNRIPFHETDIHPRELARKAHECFLTGTGAEIVPVVKIRNAPSNGGTVKLTIGDGKPGVRTKELIKLFREYTKDPKNSHPIFKKK
jgi:branched-chain amino acid aminotransferase